MQLRTQNNETKNEVIPSTFVASVPNKKLQLLIDVDDTLLVKNDEKDEFVFNEEFISLLKQMGINEVILFTRMSADRVAFDSKIRIPLVKKLNENKITVIKIITTPDVLYKHMSTSPVTYQTGDAYLKFMKPVEEALLKVKATNITRDVFKQYDDNFHIKQCKQNALQFILDAGLIKAGDTLPADKAQVKLLTQNLQSFFIKYKTADTAVDDTLLSLLPRPILSIINGYAVDNIDISFTLNHLPMYLLEENRQKNNITFNQVLEKWQQESNQVKPVKPIEALDEFLAARQQYRNTDCLMTIASESSKALEVSKGSAYQLWVEENKLSSDAIVLFIDDSNSEHKSVKTSHEHHRYQHKLIGLYPPYSRNSEFKKHTNSNFLDLEPFIREVLYNAFVLPILEKHQMSSKDSTPSQQMNELYNKGLKKIQEKDYLKALRYFEIAYLISSFDNLSDQNLKSLIASIRQARIDCDKQKNAQQLLNDENLLLDSICQSIKNIPGGFMRLKNLELDCLIFRKENEFLFTKSFFVFSAPKEINQEFEGKIIKKIQWLAKTFPESIDNCIAFLTKLKNQFYYDIYKNHMQNEIDSLIQIRDLAENVPVLNSR